MCYISHQMSRMRILTLHIVSVKCLKEELISLLTCKYFNCLSPPFTKHLESASSTCHRGKMMLYSVLALANTVGMKQLVNLQHPLPTAPLKDISKEVSCVLSELCSRVTCTRHIEVSSTQNLKQNVQEATEQEPPECWDALLSNGPCSCKPPVTKVGRGAATLVPKVPGTAKKQPAPFKQASDFILHSACDKFLKSHNLAQSLEGKHFQLLHNVTPLHYFGNLNQ